MLEGMVETLLRLDEVEEDEELYIALAYQLAPEQIVALFLWGLVGLTAIHAQIIMNCTNEEIVISEIHYHEANIMLIEGEMGGMLTVQLGLELSQGGAEVVERQAPQTKEQHDVGHVDNDGIDDHEVFMGDDEVEVVMVVDGAEI